MNLSHLQAEARLKCDIKACKTIAITIAANFLSYVPAILYAVLDLEQGSLASSWFSFFVVYSLYLCSALNPIIYYLRNSRFQSALRQFVKDPLGSSDIREKPADIDNAGDKPNRDVMVGTSNDKGTIEERDAVEQNMSGSRARRSISQDEDAEIIVSINRVPTRAWAQNDGDNASTEYRGNKVPRPVVPSVHSPGEEVQTGKKHQFLKDPKEQKRPLSSSKSSSRRKVHPLGIADLA